MKIEITRRDLFRGGRDVGGLLALSVLFPEATTIGSEIATPTKGEGGLRVGADLDQLAEAVGNRIATLTQSDGALVTCGCAAALTHATAACVAGGNPDLHVRIPNLSGFAKDEVVIPKHSRNVYDAAVRAVGVRVLEVTTPAELESAIGPKTAMIYLPAAPEADARPLNLKAVAALAQPKSVPILVDAAAEILTIPNVHLQNGATLVA